MTPSRPSFTDHRFIAVLVAVVIAAGCGNRPQEQERPISSMFQKHGELSFIKDDSTVVSTIDIEIADDPQERETGMMGRPSLRENHGMLFIFPADQFLSFWMMNTMISLDMIFIDSRGRIITIHRNTVPFSQESYAATGTGRYVLEVVAGYCDRYGIDVGDKVEWKRTDE